MQSKILILLSSVFLTLPSFATTTKKGSRFIQYMKQSKQPKFDILVYLHSPKDHVDQELSYLQRKRSVVNHLKQAAIQSQSSLLQLLKQKQRHYQSFYAVNAVSIKDVDGDTMEAIEKLPQVKRVISDHPRRFLRPISKPHLVTLLTEVQENIIDTKADLVWNQWNARGQGIVIGNQDTGVDSEHVALIKHYRGYNLETETVSHDYSWHDAIKQPIDSGSNPCGYDTVAPCDDDGHGTHTTGTIVGSTDTQIIGIAPKAQWIGCRNMDSGTGRPSTYIECFEFFLAPYPHGKSSMEGDPDKAAHVINNSWGCPASELCEGDEFLEVLDNLKNAGIMVVASAGNNGSSCSTIDDGPAHHSQLTLSVGAHRVGSHTIASFSSRGPSVYDGGLGPDITAPGSNIRSSYPNNRYASMSGTSMAGPHLVGAVALLWSHDGSLIGDIDRTTAALVHSASGKTSSQTCGGVPGDSIPNQTYGYGSLNLFQALQNL